jgi:hypothetical protein
MFSTTPPPQNPFGNFEKYKLRYYAADSKANENR